VKGGKRERRKEKGERAAANFWIGENGEEWKENWWQENEINKCCTKSAKELKECQFKV
jgi:hypothetical protein